MTYFKMFMCTLEENVYSCFHDKEIIKITNNMHLHTSYILYTWFFFKFGFRDISNKNKFYLNNRSKQHK